MQLLLNKSEKGANRKYVQWLQKNSRLYKYVGEFLRANIYLTRAVSLLKSSTERREFSVKT